MTTSVATLVQARSLRAGLTGLIVGAVLAGALAFALNATGQENRLSGTQVTGPVPEVAFDSFLRDHVAREWAPDHRASVVVQIATALREHLAREYRSGGG